MVRDGDMTFPPAYLYLSMLISVYTPFEKRCQEMLEAGGEADTVQGKVVWSPKVTLNVDCEVVTLGTSEKNYINIH